MTAEETRSRSVADTLREVPMFSQLRNDDLLHIATLLHRRRVRKSEVVLLHGDRVAALYLIGEGRVKLVATGDEGKEVILAIRAAGDFFGEASLFEDQPLDTTVIALEPTELLLLRREDLHRCLRDIPDIAIGLLRTLVRRLREADARIGVLTLLDASQRVAHVLLELADEHDGTSIARPPTHQFLAELIGVTRETVSRVMSQLAEEGLIATVREKTSLPDRRAAAAGKPAATVEVHRRALQIRDRRRLEVAAGRS